MLYVKALDGYDTNHCMNQHKRNYHGIRTHAESIKMNYPSFEDVEIEYYREMYTDFVLGQNARNDRNGHSERNRSIEELCKEQRLGRNGIENLCIKPTFNYCTGEEQFTFFKLPKCLIDDACFWGLSIDAKLLYAIFLDGI